MGPCRFSRASEPPVHQWQAGWMTRSNQCVSCSRRVFQSRDGGTTWTRVHWGFVPTALRFLSPSFGWAVVSPHGRNWTGKDCVGRVYTTNDGGKAWSRSLVRHGSAACNMVAAFADAQHGWVASTAANFVCTMNSCPFPPTFIYRTQDGGRSWRLSTTWAGKGGPFRGPGFVYGLQFVRPRPWLDYPPRQRRITAEWP